jgi:hypothetical protein
VLNANAHQVNDISSYLLCDEFSMSIEVQSHEWGIELNRNLVYCIFTSTKMTSSAGYRVYFSLLRVSSFQYCWFSEEKLVMLQ